jgi:chaperonin GroES
MAFSLKGNRIAVDAEPVNTKTESGLELPDSVLTNEPRYGTVVAVGTGNRSDMTGELVAPDITVGDRVFFHRMSGEKWKIDGTEYLVLGANEIIGVSETSLAVVE